MAKIHPTLQEDTQRFVDRYTQVFGVSVTNLVNRALRRYFNTMPLEDRAKLMGEPPVESGQDDKPIELPLSVEDFKKTVKK